MQEKWCKGVNVMKKAAIIGILLIAVYGSFKFGTAQAQVKGLSSNVTERVLTHVVSVSVDGGKFIRVQNINADSDIIILDPIKGVKVGDRVQVDFNQDEVVATKIVGDN
jgi:hypothetical protein